MSLSTHGWPILYTLFLWWFSTGAILYLAPDITPPGVDGAH